jgi:hypothetical protein
MAITILPTPPTRSDPVNFNSRADAFLSALPTFANEANALQLDVNAKQAAAALSETNAAASELAAAASSSATIWVSGTTYAIGNVRFSPITYLSYRRKTAGAGTTDPSADSTNWVLINGTGNVDLTSTQTLTNKTFSTGSVWNGNAVPIANGGTGNTTAANAFNALKQAASTTSSGVVELADSTEMITGTDTARVPSVSAIRLGKASMTASLASLSTYTLNSIPSWVTRINIIITNMSTTAASNIFLTLNGYSAGYNSTFTKLDASAQGSLNYSTGVLIVSSTANNAATDLFSGRVQLESVRTNNEWHTMGLISENVNVNMCLSNSNFDTTTALTTLSISTSAGTFDSGSLYISWE